MAVVEGYKPRRSLTMDKDHLGTNRSKILRKTTLESDSDYRPWADIISVSSSATYYYFLNSDV